jgi:hypothetical protein
LIHLEKQVRKEAPDSNRRIHPRQQPAFFTLKPNPALAMARLLRRPAPPNNPADTHAKIVPRNVAEFRGNCR